MKIRKYMLAGLSGVLMVSIFPGINLSALAWVALVPLLIAIHDANWKQSFILGFITGVIYFGGIMNWLLALYPFTTWFWIIIGFVLLTLYLSAYVFIFSVSVRFITRYWKRSSSIYHLAYSFLVAVVWTGLEFLRGWVMTGLPWAGLGHSQWQNLPLIQISSIVGMYGVTFLVALINGAVAIFIIDIDKWRASIKTAVIPLALVIISLIYGWIALSETSQGDTIKIALVPGNIKQMDKLMAWGSGGARLIMDKYVRATQRAAAEEPDMIVWPETCVPLHTFASGNVPIGLSSLVQKWKAYFLMGTPHAAPSPPLFDAKVEAQNDLNDEAISESLRREFENNNISLSDDARVLVREIDVRWYIVDGNRIYIVKKQEDKVSIHLRETYNAAFLLSPTGEEIDRYYKMHLVPISEYFPMKRYLPESWQKLVTGVSDWDSGSEQIIFSAPPAKFGLVICFESVFPGIFRKAVSKGVNLMGIITNDAWFDGTYAAEQHYSMAPFRAVENKVSVFRCANLGISCIIDPWGRVVQKITPKDDAEYLVGEVRLRQGGTFYTRHGDYLPWMCLFATLFLVFQAWWYMRKSIE